MTKALVIDYKDGVASVMLSDDVIIDVVTARVFQMGEEITVSELEIESDVLIGEEPYMWGGEEHE